MTQPALQNAVNAAKTAFVATLQAAFAEAAPQIISNLLLRSPLAVTVPGFDAQAEINPTNGAVSLSGTTVTEIETLLAVAQSVHALLGSSPVHATPEPPAAPAPAPEVVPPAPAAVPGTVPPVVPAQP